MKTFKISLLCLLLCIMSAMSFAQTPEKMSYQAVFRNMYDRLITEQPVAVQISILQGGAEGTVVFQETQTVTTNADGIATFEIGGGTAVVGTLKDINWAEGPYFLKAEMDPEGGEDFTVNGAVELVAVPYAFYANASAGEFSGKYEDLTGAPEIPVVPTNISELENTSGFMDKEAQQLVKTGNTLTLTEATNIVELPAFNVFESDPTKNVVNRPEGVKAGELMYWDAEAGTWKTVAPGVAGYVLRMGEDGVPVWQRRPGTKTAPQVTITAGEEMTYSATIGDNGGSDVTARGFKYATTAGVANNTSATDIVIADGDEFTAIIPATGHNVTYYVVAYATNEKGTSYSDELSFTTPDFPRCGTLVDIDGNEYKTVIIGTQCWMAESMRAKRYPDGTALQEWTVALRNSGAKIYGVVSDPTIGGEQVLYSWRGATNLNAANTDQTKIVQGICPDGWHIPSYRDCATLLKFVDPAWDAGSETVYTNRGNVGNTAKSNNQQSIKLCAKDAVWEAYSGPGIGAVTATCHTNPNSPGYAYANNPDDPQWQWDIYGFNARPAGYIIKDKTYTIPAGASPAQVHWWNNGTMNMWTSISNSSAASGYAQCVKFSCYETGVPHYMYSNEVKSTYSVRCVRDALVE